MSSTCLPSSVQLFFHRTFTTVVATISYLEHFRSNKAGVVSKVRLLNVAVNLSVFRSQVTGVICGLAINNKSMALVS